MTGNAKCLLHHTIQDDVMRLVVTQCSHASQRTGQKLWTASFFFPDLRGVDSGSLPNGHQLHKTLNWHFFPRISGKLQVKHRLCSPIDVARIQMTTTINSYGNYSKWATCSWTGWSSIPDETTSHYFPRLLCEDITIGSFSRWGETWGKQLVWVLSG